MLKLTNFIVLLLLNFIVFLFAMSIDSLTARYLLCALLLQIENYTFWKLIMI